MAPALRCAQPGCTGAVVDGYCDTCGLAPASGAARAVPPSAAGEGAAAHSSTPLPPLLPAALVGSRRAVTTPTFKVGPGALAPTTPGRCTHAGCAGTVVDGYCDTCGMAPAAGAGPSEEGTGSARLGSTRTGRSSRTARAAIGVGLVDVPPVPMGDPSKAVMADPEVPEDKRFCSVCGEPVGRTKDDRPGRVEGFCANCGARYSFVPKLGPGDLLAGQYEVLGAIAHGGLGWIYLAKDRNVSDRWVVLKGLLDTGSEDAMLAALAERRFLASVEHPQLVKIFNFVTHDGAGYIVMEYVGGKSLKTILKDRRKANGDVADPLPLDQAIAYVIGILPAMGYLHAEGLVYCDMKPDNIMQTGESLKVIDLGGVRAVDDPSSAIYGTVGFQAPEIAELGPSVSSDLFTVGRTLAVLILDFKGYQGRYATTLPPPDEQPLLAEQPSLHRFLLKATAADRDVRFQSAEEMSEQLLGVLREVVARNEGTPKPAVSSLFGPDPLAARGDAGDGIVADWRLLPTLKVDPSDPAAAFLLGLGDPSTAAEAITSALATGLVPQTAETDLRLSRARLEVGDRPGADEALDRVADQRDWRVWWHRALVAMAGGDGPTAVGWLDPTVTELPGELAPKLALALAHEVAGNLDEAARLYDVVSTVDPAYVSAAFGLARCRLGRADRGGAVAAYTRVPASSSVHGEAQVAAARALIRTSGSDVPEAGELVQAASALSRLNLDARSQAELVRDLFEAGLALLRSKPGTGNGEKLLGRTLEPVDLRLGLERAYRDLARLAPTAEERVALVDRANTVRPRTLV